METHKKNETYWEKAYKNYTRKKLLKNTLTTIAISFITVMISFIITLLILTLT